LNIQLSDRINPVYRNLIRYRNNQSWGHLPPTDEIFDFFESVTEYTNVHRILETGFNFGISAATQLTVHPEATLVSYDPLDWNISSGIYDNGYRFPLTNCRVSTIGKLVWGDRLVFHKHRSSRVTQDYPVNYFDYAFLDGDHSYEGLYMDVQCCIELKIPYVFIDNIEKVADLAKVVEDVDNLVLIKDLQYTAIHPSLGTSITDTIGLFELKQ